MWLSNKLSLVFFTQEVFLSLEKAFGLHWENGEEPTGRASKWIWPKLRRWKWKSRETGSSCWTVIAVLCCCCFAGCVILNDIFIFISDKRHLFKMVMSSMAAGDGGKQIFAKIPGGQGSPDKITRGVPKFWIL